MSQSQTPILIGVGDHVNRSLAIADAHEPLTLILRAIDSALQDSGLPPARRQQLQAAIDSIDVVRTWTWPYDDLPGDIGRRLGVEARHRFYSEHGGNKPAKLFDNAARRIARGQTKVAVVAGGEALASFAACVAAQKIPPPGWTKTSQNVASIFSPSKLHGGRDIGFDHSITAPIQIYPLFENAFRAHRGQSIPENHDESAQLYAEFAQIAAHQPFSWSYGKPAKTKEEIGSVTKRNRMICFPYPLLMNAFNTINLAGACILTSAEYAEELGVSKTKWIYVLGGAGTQDSDHFWDRPNYYSSPSIERSIDTALAVSGLAKEDIDLFDFYSCFPIVPKMAAAHLNLPITHGSKPLTLLGGLTSFGGAGNNYSMHAITEMTRQLRQGKGQHGLILANGGWMTYEHALCLSTLRRRDGIPYPAEPPLSEHVTDVAVPSVDAQAEGEAVIETYTVDFDRQVEPTTRPLLAHIVGRLVATGHRFVANHADPATLERLAGWTDEKIGLTGHVRHDRRTRRNLFCLSASKAASRQVGKL
ncbi:hypothetical protein A1O3_02173 [Capronia epimyces CBS 606.96]|uniref:Thiolase-like protein type 1 additional C-terminal domain-containing protein n=1 Tax=Capronia epimyces CBS 606.96 TaxID=1182542 RepID=W9Z3N2_9EURO|nr:uncharacterized protein A1O3_02173 [Capronia epimyces CBS 606.96]EXJ89109.1 hypothetical protein A1O3_02173 [Capronia epimyces CBS 606.96]